MKKSGREKRAKISLALYMFLVFCLFISAFDSSQPRDVDKMSDPPAFYFVAYIFHSFLFSFFPLRFLSLSFPLYLFFYSFYSMLLYSIILSLYMSPCLLHIIFLFFFLPSIVFLSLSLFIFSFMCILLLP